MRSPCIPKSLRPQVEGSSKGIDTPRFEKHLDGEGHPWASVARSRGAKQLYGPPPQIPHGIAYVGLRQARNELDRVEQVGFAGCVGTDDCGERAQVETEVPEGLETVNLDARNHGACPMLQARVTVGEMNFLAAVMYSISGLHSFA